MTMSEIKSLLFNKILKPVHSLLKIYKNKKFYFKTTESKYNEVIRKKRM